VERDRKLTAVLKGEARADAAESLELAQMCQQYRKRHAAATRLYAEALAAQPRLTDDPGAGHRYHAACAAALAGCGRGEDAGQLDHTERARLRQQALDWLRADLTAWTRVLDKATPQARAAAQQHLRRWQQDPDLAGLRDAAALAKLPTPEREACQKLWTDVDTVLKRAQPKPAEP
jgi:serine/threonine-protein kinase